MSSTIATVASSNGGLGNERQVIYAVNAGLWWAFAYTSTNVLASYSSPDGVTWTARATFTLAQAHGSEGRNLSVDYLQVSTLDVVYAEITFAPTGLQLQVQSLRGTISNTTLTWHTSATNISAATGDAATLLWSGTGIDFDSSNRATVASGWVNSASGDTAAARGSADPGTAEQATPPTWGTMTTIDAGMANENRANYVIRRGGANMGLVATDGSGTTSTTGLDWYTFNGTAWSGTSLNRSVTGSITAIDQNDWGAVTVGSTAHVVYRASTGTLTHRVFNGTSWGAGQTIPAQGNATGTGIALSTDGTNVWLVLIANDANKTVRYIKWTAAGTAWDAAWTVLESSAATRTFISCAELVSTSKISVIWHESTSLVSGLITLAAPVASPLRVFTRLVRIQPRGRAAATIARGAPTPLPAIQVTAGHVRRARPAVKGRFTLVPPPAAPLAPRVPATEHLRFVLPAIKGRFTLIFGAPTPMRPRMTAEHIKQVRPHGTARAQVAGVSLAAPALAVYTRLLRAMPALRGKAQVATPGPLPGFPISPSRNPLVRIVTALRGRTAPITRAIPQPQVVHTLLKTPGTRPLSRGQVARPGPLPGQPLTSFTRLRFPGPIRRGIARLIGFMTTPYTGSVTIFDYVYDSQGKPVVGKRVEVQLLSSSWVYIDSPTSWSLPVVIIAITDANGYWEVTTTAGTPAVNYAVSVPGIASYEIAVPAAPGPFQSSTILAS